MEVEGLGDWVMWLWLKKLCSSIFSNMVEASMLREASIDVKQYMVSTPTSTDDPREVRARIFNLKSSTSMRNLNPSG